MKEATAKYKGRVDGKKIQEIVSRLLPAEVARSRGCGVARRPDDFAHREPRNRETTDRNAHPLRTRSATPAISSSPRSARRDRRNSRPASVLVVGAGGLGSPVGALPRGGRRRTHRARRLRRCRRQQPSSPGALRHLRRRQAEARRGAGAVARSQSRDRHRDARRGADVGERAGDRREATT